MDLRKLQLTEKEILQAVIDVCEKLEITYFLVSGSLLGAVRHGGFIPWDDDIDIIIPRPDYDKFLHSAQELLPAHYFLQTHQTDQGYLLPFAKIRDSRTTFVEKALMLRKINHGVFIDVFPLDGFPKNKIRRFAFLMKNKLYTLRLSRENYAAHRSLKWKIASIIATAFCPSAEGTWRRRDKLLQSVPYEKAKLVANIGNAWGSREIVSKTVFQTSIKGVFEGMEVSLPKEYDVYLAKLYGDYMTFPPVEKRVPHHHYLLLDLEKSYIENEKTINQLIKKELGM